MSPLTKTVYFGKTIRDKKFRATLQSEDIQRMIHDFMNTTTITRKVDMNLDAVENIRLSTAKRRLKIKETHTPPISERKWMSHFQSLHSNEPLNEQQEAIIDELQNAEDITTRSHSLGYLITENEIRTAVRELKNNKSSFSDKIKNEMIKSSLNELMLV